jgi:hypothetical protein
VEELAISQVLQGQKRDTLSGGDLLRRRMAVACLIHPPVLRAEPQTDRPGTPDSPVHEVTTGGRRGEVEMRLMKPRFGTYLASAMYGGSPRRRYKSG